MRLFDQEKNQLRKFLSENLNEFPWSPIDMPGLDPSIISHRLSILPESKMVKQKPPKMNTECFHALNEEVNRLLKAGFIRETLYPD